MKAVLQRVREASVRVDAETVGQIGPGLLILICVEQGDGAEEAAFFARKIVNMRIFEDANGKFNRSLLDVQGEALVVSQFTLSGDWRKGNRPSFSRAAAPEEANRLYEIFCDHLRDAGVGVQTGIFAAKMDVSLINDGPVTIWMDSRAPDNTVLEARS